jgi:hypothetical protein
MRIRLQDQDDKWPQCTPADAAANRERNNLVNPATTSSQRAAAKLELQRVAAIKSLSSGGSRTLTPRPFGVSLKVE